MALQAAYHTIYTAIGTIKYQILDFLMKVHAQNNQMKRISAIMLTILRLLVARGSHRST